MGLVVIINTGLMLLFSSLQLAAMVHGGRGTNEKLLQFYRFTLPDSLVEVYGSPLQGSCGQSHGRVCINDMRTVLSNGIIPESVNISSDNWAAEFFTLNITTSIEIGFRFREAVAIQEVCIFPLICPSAGFGVSTVTLYGSEYLDLSSAFNINDAVQLGSTSVTGNDAECATKKITVFSEHDYLQNNTELGYFYLVFNFNTTDTNITWLFIGEIQFFHHSIPTSITAATSSISLPEHTPITTTSSSFTFSSTDATRSFSLTGPGSISSASVTAFPSPTGSASSSGGSSGGGGGNAGAIAGGVVVGLVFIAALTAGTIIVIVFLVKRQSHTTKNTDLDQETVYEDMDNMEVDHQADAIATELNEAYEHATAGTTHTGQVTASSQEEAYGTVDSTGLDDHYATIS